MRDSIKIFICYTFKDGIITRIFLEKLQLSIKSYCKPYIDLLDNDSEDKQDRVEKELKSADYIVLIKTKNINQSDWVKREIYLAQNHGIPILEFDYQEIIENEFLPITSCIKHLAVSGLSSVSARIKSSCNLKRNRFEMPNVSYTQPLCTNLKTI